MEITVQTAAKLRITEAEFELIKTKLGRTPNFTELCAFSGMWSPVKKMRGCWILAMVMAWFLK
ncbi:MAG: hypothetical protein NT127_00555 [Sphingobacteriales bacterium]|nr:hypothetical protein [Sphingobacteriales bacterium]